MPRFLDLSNKVLAKSALNSPVSVLDHGAVGDGATDDWEAFQDAVDTLKLSSSKNRRLIVPWTENGYRIDGSVIVRGCHGLTVEGENTLIFGTAAGKAPIHVRIADAGSPPEYGDVYDISYVPARYLTGRYRPGDTTITMTGSGESSSETPVTGDWIHIRTGDVVSGDSIATPIAEINFAVDVTGNVITLAYPLKHPYCDFGDATFGVSVVNDLITKDLTLRGLHLHHDSNRGANLWAAVRLTVDDCHFSGAGALHARGRFMDLNYTADLTPDWDNGFRPYVLALDTSTSDVTGTVKAVSSGGGIVHLHEGVASADLRIDVQCAPSDDDTEENWSVVSLLAACRDVRIRGTVTNSPLGPAIYSNPSTVYESWGNENCEVDVVVNGTVAGEVVKHNADFTTGATQDVLLVPSLGSGLALAGTSGFGTGPIATSKFTQPVALTAFSGESPTETTEDGETVWSCADSVVQGVEAVADVPSGGWTHAMLTVEVESVDAASDGNAVLYCYGRAGVSGRTPDMSGAQDVTQTLACGKAGRTTFARVNAALGAGSRVQYRIRRNGSGGSDTLAGAIKLRRAWITYYVSPTAAIGSNVAAAIEASGPTLALSDNNSVYTITGPATQTVTIPAVSSLVEGWRCWIHADVAVNANAPITITATGGVSASLAPGDLALAYVANGAVAIQKFRAHGSHSGTFTSPAARTTNVDIYDYYTITAMAQAVTINNPTGTPSPGQRLTYAFKDDGTSRGITWGSAFRGITAALPSATTISKWLYVEFAYNDIDSKWDAVGVHEQP